MAIKELFYDNRPQVLLDPRASQRIDPRFKFTRNSIGTYIKDNQSVQVAQANEPRIDSDNGILIEPSTQNFVTNSEPSAATARNTFLGINNPTPYYAFDANVAAASRCNIGGLNVAPLSALDNNGYSSGFETNWGGLSGGPALEASHRDNNYYISFFINPGTFTGEIYAGALTAGNTTFISRTVDTLLFDAGSYVGSSKWLVLNTFADGTYRLAKYITEADKFNNGLYIPSTMAGWCTFTIDPGNGSNYWWVGGLQYEQSPAPSSYIPTSGSAVTRAADLLSVEAPLPTSGSVYIDARAITANENDTLLSLKNSSNDKIDLAYLSSTSTYNSLALIANYDGTSKTSLPLPVPTTTRERNIITWGTNNYQYTRDSSRFATSLSSSVPTGLNQLSIGHDAIDPTKAFNGYINTVYAWSGELTPAVAEALVRNDLEPINADTYSPVGPAGSLALVINTQGATTGGDKTFTLPAESAATDNDIVITWGDGTESGLDGADAEVGASGLTHTYPAAGIYPVWVEGQMQNIYYNNIANANDVLEISAWGTGDTFTAPSTMANAFYGCTQMDFSSSARNTNLPDTSAVTSWFQAFYNCSSITGTFPAFNFSAATNFTRAWRGCSSMTSFVAAGDQTQNVTNFSEAWRSCSGLTSFPLINTSAGSSFSQTWNDCSSLTSFPLINTSAATTVAEAWRGCSGLTSFPLINTAAVTSFFGSWTGCSSLTSFPLLNTSSGTNFQDAWTGCAGLTSFPLLDTGNGTSFFRTWQSCSGLTSFPLLDTSSATNLQAAWAFCGGLTSFPAINTAACTNFRETWRDCTAIASFPSINTSSGQNFALAWYNNDGLTSFPVLDFDAATGLASDASNTFTGFRQAWAFSGALATFPANLFNNTICTRYLDAFNGCALTAASIENIIVSIEAAGTSNGNLGLEGGTNAGASTWTAAAVTAYDALVARGWTITRNA